MNGIITNHTHYQAHKLVLDYQRIMSIPDTAQRLAELTQWQQKMQEYGKVKELKQVV